MTTPLKPGESPEMTFDEWLERDCDGAGFCLICDSCEKQLRAILDRRGEEERAKALEEAALLVWNDEIARDGTFVRAYLLEGLRDRIRSLAAAPSGDAKGTK